MSQPPPRTLYRAQHPALDGVHPASVIDKSSPVPLHHQLELFLRRLLEERIIAPHGLLPTEQELQEHFQLSRTPIRQALNKLAAEGLIDRRRSQGTIALPQPFEESLDSLSTFTEEVQRKGQRPGSRLLDFVDRPADAEERHLLGLAEGERVFVVQRLRMINDDPVGILSSHVPVRMAPNLHPTDFTESGPQQSLYHVFEKLHGLRPVRASETFRAVTLSADQGALLHLPPGTAVLMRSRVTFEITGRAFAYEQGLYRGVYRLEWSGHKLREMDTTGAATEPLAAP